MRVWLVHIKARWIPLVVNRFPDYFSGKWEPKDVEAAKKAVESKARKYRVEDPVFRFHPVGETIVAHSTYVATK